MLSKDEVAANRKPPITAGAISGSGDRGEGLQAVGAEAQGGLLVMLAETHQTGLHHQHDIRQRRALRMADQQDQESCAAC